MSLYEEENHFCYMFLFSERRTIIQFFLLLFDPSGHINHFVCMLSLDHQTTFQ